MQATSDAHTLLGSTNGGEKGAMSERKLDALILNMERVAACMEKSHTGIYKRVINTYDIGNPGPVGMFAFALSLAFYMTSQVSEPKYPLVRGLHLQVSRRGSSLGVHLGCGRARFGADSSNAGGAM